MHPAHRVPFDVSMYVINLTSWRPTLPAWYRRIPHREHRPTPLQRPTGCCYWERISCLQSHTKHESTTYGKISISLMLHQVYFSVIKPTICTIFRVYWKSLYMFRLSVHHKEFNVYIIQVSWLHASVPPSMQSSNLYDIYLMLCVQSWTPDDGRKDRPKHVEWF